MNKSFRYEAIQPQYAEEIAVAYQAIFDLKASAIKSGAKVFDDVEDDDEDRADPSYDVLDGIGIYRISGPILSSGNEWTRWLGYSDYDAIRNDLIAMASDVNVKEIMLLMASPGGSVFGVTNAANAIAKVDAIKPVYAYTGKNMASGAYWLGASAREIYASPEAELGSIGVIVTHISQQKAMEDAGYKVTIIKSDELKAVGGPFQDLTDKEVAHIQGQVDTYDDLFKSHVQSVRPSVKISSMKAQTFIGADAVRVGLADGVMDYDAVINYIKSKRTITQTQIGGYTMKMTAEQLQAALDSGSSLEDLGLSAEEVAEITASMPQEEPEVQVEEGKEEALDLGVIVEGLKVEALAREEELGALRAAVAAKPDVNVELKAIVCEIVDNRRTALGLQKVDMAEFSVDTVLVEYKAVSKEFKKAFVTGGLPGLKQAREEAAVKVPEMDSTQAGRFQAVSVKNK